MHKKNNLFPLKKTVFSMKDETVAPFLQALSPGGIKFAGTPPSLRRRDFEIFRGLTYV